MRDFEESITQEELAFKVAMVGDTRAEDIKVGLISRVPSGLCAAWVRCPLVAANKLAKKGAIRVRWSRARVELLPAHPLQCFKCLEGGM